MPCLHRRRVSSQQVEKEGTREKCTYCRATNAAFTLADLSNRIHQVLEEHFEPIPEDDLPEQYKESLPDVETVIEEVAGLEQHIAADVRKYLLNSLSQTVNVVEGDENPYSNGMLYNEREADTSDFRSAWWDFKEESRSRARFLEPPLWPH